MSFASEVKDELALKESDYPKDELSALFKTLGNITISNGKMSINFKSENAKIAQKVFRKIHTLYEIKPVTSIYRKAIDNFYQFGKINITNKDIEDLKLIFKNV